MENIFTQLTKKLGEHHEGFRKWNADYWEKKAKGEKEAAINSVKQRPFKCDVGYASCTEQGHCKGWC